MKLFSLPPTSYPELSKKEIQKAHDLYIKILDDMLFDSNYYSNKDYFLCTLLNSKSESLLKYYFQEHPEYAWLHHQLLNKHSGITPQENHEVNLYRIFILQLLIEITEQ